MADFLKALYNNLKYRLFYVFFSIKMWIVCFLVVASGLAINERPQFRNETGHY